MRLYHEGLDRVCDIPDDENLAAVMAESGWSKTVPADHDDPALAAEQPGTVYKPVSPAKSEAKGRTTKSTKSD